MPFSGTVTQTPHVITITTQWWNALTTLAARTLTLRLKGTRGIDDELVVTQRRDIWDYYSEMVNVWSLTEIRDMRLPWPWDYRISHGNLARDIIIRRLNFKPPHSLLIDSGVVIHDVRDIFTLPTNLTRLPPALINRSLYMSVATGGTVIHTWI